MHMIGRKTTQTLRMDFSVGRLEARAEDKRNTKD
jgi:hypothetical protein